MDLAVSLTILTDEKKGFLVLETMKNLASRLLEDVGYKYANFHASSLSDSSEDEEELHHDDETMAKIQRALSDYGLNSFLVQECINRLQNDGILFRERSKKDQKRHVHRI